MLAYSEPRNVPKWKSLSILDQAWVCENGTRPKAPVRQRGCKPRGRRMLISLSLVEHSHPPIGGLTIPSGLGVLGRHRQGTKSPLAELDSTHRT